MDFIKLQSLFIKLFAALAVMVVSSCTNPLGDGSNFGKMPKLKWDNQSFDYGHVGVGSSTNATFTLVNDGENGATGCSPIYLSDTTNFSIVANSCQGTTMSIGQQCYVEIASHPMTEGLKTLTISRSCDGGAVIQTPEAQISVIGVLPILAWSPLTNHFGNVYVGSASSPQAFTLSNTGSAEASGCGSATLSDNTNFSITANSCATSPLSASGTCIVSVRANPMSTGNKSTTLSRTCSIGGVVKTTVNQIKVTGQSATLAWSPITYNFGSHLVGSDSATQTFTLNNTGNVTATGCSAPTITNGANFFITNDTCGTSDLANGASCAIQVKGNAVSTGTKYATISRVCSVGGTVSTTSNQIMLTGTGSATLSWSPLTNNFGDVETATQSAAQSFTLTNGGSISASGCAAPILSDSANFTISTDGCGSSPLAAAASCNVSVKAQPQSLGAVSTTLSRTCTVGGTISTTSQQIVANGVAPAGVILGITPLTSDFGDLGVGEDMYADYFEITNSGVLDATNCSAPVLSNSTDFYISYDECDTYDLSAGNTCYLEVSVKPQSLGLKTTTLSRTCTVGGTISTTANEIKVNGVAPAAHLDFPQVSFTWGNINEGTETSTVDATLVNDGTGTTSGCSAPVLADPINFTIVNDWCGTSNLSARGGACTIRLKANPQSGGLKTSTITRTCTDGGTATLNLTATGVQNVSWQNAYSLLNFGSAKVGADSSDFTYYFKNASAAGLTGCTAVNLNNAMDFNIVSDGCNSATMSPNSLCRVVVKANATSTGARNGALSRTCNETGVIGITFDVTGTNGAAIVTQLAASGQHTCALISDGTVKCWGYNGYGQLGDGTTTNKLIPTPVLGITTAIEIAVGAYHSCALLSDKTVRCWGNNSQGELGSGSAYNQATTSSVVVSGLSNVDHLALGEYYSCALLADLTVKCWGKNAEGQIGDGTTNQRLAPTSVSGLSGILKIRAHQSHACAQLSDNTVKCWGGTNSYGQLGDGTGNNNSLVPVVVSGLSNVTDIRVAWGHSCALLSDQTVKCWGYNVNGQLGNGNTTNQATPVSVSSLTGVAKIAIGNSSSCAVLNDATMKCWGGNSSGQLGDNTTVNRLSPTVVANISGVSLVESGSHHVCVKVTDGSFKCWGNNYYGQMGDGTIYNRMASEVVPGISTAAKVSMGSNHTCALLTDGTAKCWGSNSSGQLGYGALANSVAPVVATGLSNGTQIVSGDRHTCVLLSDKTVKCWGSSSGVGSPSQQYSPWVVTGVSDVNHIAAGYYSTCVVYNNNTARCWGMNNYGQLGDGSTTSKTVGTSVLVSGLTNAVKISSADLHSCALTTSGTIKCWGYNAQGQLGDGTTTNQLVPTVEVPGITNAIDVSASGGYTCALLSNGKIKCWGAGWVLGNGSSSSSVTPVEVYGISNATQLMTSYVSSCALLSSGLVKCWGYNQNSQLGDGLVANKLTPSFSLNMNSILSIGTGVTARHQCNVKSDNTVLCLGYNEHGETGYDEYSKRRVSGL